MRFLEIINEKKFILISISLFIYIMINLFEGQRGIISYYKALVVIGPGCLNIIIPFSFIIKVSGTP